MALFDRKPQQPQRERTREDRERARAEREARRAAREGTAPMETHEEAAAGAETPAPPAAPAPVVNEPPAPPAPVPATPAPVADEPPATPAPVAEERPAPQVTDRAAAQPEARPPAMSSPAETPQATASPTTTSSPATMGPNGQPENRPPALPPTPAPPPAPAIPPRRTTPPRPTLARRAAPADAPSVVFDDAVAEDWSAVDAPPPRRRRRGGAAAPPGPRRRWPLALLLAAVLTILVGGWFVLSLFQPLHGDGGEPTSVAIPRGAGISQAGDILAARGVVSSEFFFKLRARLEGTGEIKPGNYTLPEDSAYGDVLAALEKGPPPPKTTDITITEGRTIVEANRLLRRTSLRGSYAAAAGRSTALRPQQYGAPRSIRTKEGFLFPATYKVRVGAPVSDLVAKQLQTFRRQFATVNLAYARSKKLTPYDVLIIASMIEREASVAKDRRLISSVIYNRLAQSIPLGIDATIRYELDNWQRPLRMSELERDTPYNTRLRQGLPPTPIGNPGLASIRAAANPARTQFLYFVVKPCGKGEHAFTKTDAEFQRAVQRYEAERQRQGRSPVDC